MQRYIFLMLFGAGSLCAGDFPEISELEVNGYQRDEGVSAGDWCETLLTERPVIHEDKDAVFLQKLKLYFLYHHQFSYVDGTDRNGRDFSDANDENRRFWWGLEGKFARYFKFKAASNFSRDLRGRGGEWGLGHENFRSFYATFDAGKAFDWNVVDGLEFGYGRRSIRMTDGWRRSASHINTIERTSFSNKMWPNDEDGANPLAAWVKVKQGISTFDFALVSTDEESWVPEWDEGVMYFASWEGDFSEMSGFELNDLWLSGFYQDAQEGDEDLANEVEWAVALVSRLGEDRWAWHNSLGLGQNGMSGDRDGLFWGVYTQPMYWLVEDRLKLVLRYQYQAAEEAEGIQINSRYARIAEGATDGVDINGGRGDEHHSFYAGLNYYLCGENAKIVSGVLYDYLESDGERVYDGWTTAVGLRVFF